MVVEIKGSFELERPIKVNLLNQFTTSVIFGYEILDIRVNPKSG